MVGLALGYHLEDQHQEEAESKIGLKVIGEQCGRRRKTGWAQTEEMKAIPRKLVICVTSTDMRQWFPKLANSLERKQSKIKEINIKFSQGNFVLGLVSLVFQLFPCCESVKTELNTYIATNFITHKANISPCFFFMV